MMGVLMALEALIISLIRGTPCVICKLGLRENTGKKCLASETLMVQKNSLRIILLDCNTLSNVYRPRKHNILYCQFMLYAGSVRCTMVPHL